jgi:hypothetical protein
MCWLCGEPTLDEVLSDPIILTLMKADGTNLARLCDLLARARQSAAGRGGEAGTQAGPIGFGPHH